MRQIQRSLPTVTIYIETHNPDFAGCIITIWDDKIEKKVELRLLENELNELVEEVQSAYILTIANYLKKAHEKLVSDNQKLV
ncbi:hypothetical protein [Spirosoma litoris]